MTGNETTLVAKDGLAAVVDDTWRKNHARLRLFRYTMMMVTGLMLFSAFIFAVAGPMSITYIGVMTSLLLAMFSMMLTLFSFFVNTLFEHLQREQLDLASRVGHLVKRE